MTILIKAKLNKSNEHTSIGKYRVLHIKCYKMIVRNLCKNCIINKSHPLQTIVKSDWRIDPNYRKTTLSIIHYTKVYNTYLYPKLDTEIERYINYKLISWHKGISAKKLIKICIMK